MNKEKIWECIYDNINLISMSLDRNNQFYLFGYNPYSEGIINELYRKGICIKNILDNSSELERKKVGNCEIISPQNINEREMKNAIVFIASQHYESMEDQLIKLFPTAEIKTYLLFDFKKNNFQDEEKKKYWKNEEFEKQIKRLEMGKSIYKKWKQPSKWLILSPTISIGDNFLWNLSFEQYRKENRIEQYRIIVTSKGAKKAIALFGKQDIQVISKDEMDDLCKFTLFVGESNLESMIVYPRFSILRCLDIMASWKGMAWQQIYTDYLFLLRENFNFKFPNIWANKSKTINELEFSKGKTVILSPYANTVGEVPIVFWEILVQKLKSRGFNILTNIVNNQTPINGTMGINIPLAYCGSYLEHAGNFVSIRNGLCDIVGKAKCKQVVIFRNRRQLHCTEMQFNDLHINDISPEALYVLYDDDDIEKSVNDVFKYITYVEDNSNGSSEN